MEPATKRKRWLAAAAGVAGLVFLVGVMVNPSLVTLREEVLSREPSGLIDGSGREPDLVTLRVTYGRGAGMGLGGGGKVDYWNFVAFRNEPKQVEARVEGSWVPVGDTFNLQQLHVGQSQEITVLVPGASDALRVRVGYSRPPWLARVAGRWRWAVERLPWSVQKWIWSLPSAKPVWREIQLEVPLGRP